MGLLVVGGGVVFSGGPTPSRAEVAVGPDTAPAQTGEAEPDAAPVEAEPRAEIAPKPLSEHVQRGLAWLVAQQMADGGWGQGEESVHMQRKEAPRQDPSNVADTSVAILALLRAGSTPADGPHAEAIADGVAFVLESVEASDPSSMWVTEVRGTRLQSKIGQYTDTFLSALMLSEVKGQMPDEDGNQRVAAALNKVVQKIQKNQQADGGWGDRGWAAGLGGGIGVKAINRAAQAGADVDVDQLARTQAARRSASKLGAEGRFAADEADAGIELYSAANELGTLNDYSMTNRELRPQLERAVAATAAENQRLAGEIEAAEAEGDDAEVVRLRRLVGANDASLDSLGEQLDNFTRTEAKLGDVRAATIQRFNDPAFVAGFGNNGGEEFLSYLQVGEALVAEGGNDFIKWDQEMTQNLNRVQNQDGSWSGHHCITGRTFCTSMALMVLTVDRTANSFGALGHHQ